MAGGIFEERVVAAIPTWENIEIRLWCAEMDIPYVTMQGVERRELARTHARLSRLSQRPFAIKKVAIDIPRDKLDRPHLS